MRKELKTQIMERIPDENMHDNYKNSSNDLPQVWECIIIGSGFSGLCQGIQLKEADRHNFLILEKASSLGGTWRDNAYPGAACDIPSILYSYSFEAANTSWTRNYADQPSILRYIQQISNKYNLTPHLQFNQRVCRLEYNNDDHLWSVYTNDNERQEYARAQFVITGVGQLHQPMIPPFQGTDTFQGDMIHTAQFGNAKRRKEFYAHKNVAVIGNGASAVQIIPELQKICKNVYVFQRTPSYVMMKAPSISLLEKVINTFSLFKWLHRSYLALMGEVLLFGAIQGKWWAQKILKYVCAVHREQHILDESLRTKLTPDYPIGAKRLLFSDDYYPALVQENVHLITTKGIKRIEKNTIVAHSSNDDDDGGTDEQVVEVDDIIFATGFITNPFLYGIQVYGVNKQKLWSNESDGSHAYLGVNSHGFPNLFFLMGPNTQVGHTSNLLFIEEQTKFVTKSIQYLDRHNLRALEVRKDVEEAFVAEVETRSQTLTYCKIQKSWYLSSNGKLTNPWIGGFPEYKRRLQMWNILEDFQVYQNDPMPQQVNLDQDQWSIAVTTLINLWWSFIAIVCFPFTGVTRKIDTPTKKTV